MNSREFICALLSRGYNRKFYSLLEEEMFNDEVSVKILRALKSGFHFSSNHLEDFRDIAKIKLADLTDIVEDVNKYDGWLTESDVLDFVREYRTRKSKEYYSKGDMEKAMEYIQPVECMAEASIIDNYKAHLEEVRDGADKDLIGITTGLKSLDTVSGGLIPSKVWIVAGYNAYGKTYFMTNIINNILDLEKRVCVITLEMTTNDILDRLIGQRLGFGVFSLAKTENKDSVEKMTDLLRSHIEEKNLCIVDSYTDIDQIISKIKIENFNRHIDVLCLDFIQLVGAKSVKSIYEKMSYVSQELQKLTKEIGCCSVFLSQVNNASQSGASGDVYGFKGAGEIGQIADIAIKIKREKDGTGGFTPQYILDLVKNRSGKTGEIVCRIDFPSGAISEDINLIGTFNG